VRIVCQEETEGPGKNPVAEWTFFFVAKAEASKTYAGKSEEQGMSSACFKIVSDCNDEAPAFAKATARLRE
jgi:hypothetical protein